MGPFLLDEQKCGGWVWGVCGKRLKLSGDLFFGLN